MPLERQHFLALESEFLDLEDHLVLPDLQHPQPADGITALEAMDLVAASWRNGESTCVLATVDGGRSVAALRTPEGRWAACNAFLDKRCKSPQEAQRELDKLLKRGRRGYIGVLTHDAGI